MESNKRKYEEPRTVLNFNFFPNSSVRKILKDNGAKWDSQIKAWYINVEEENLPDILKELQQKQPPIVSENTRTYCLKEGSFIKREIIKSLGGKWDGESKSWYFTGRMDELSSDQRALCNPQKIELNASIIIDYLRENENVRNEVMSALNTSGVPLILTNLRLP